MLLHRAGVKVIMSLKAPQFLKRMHLSVVMATTCHLYALSLKRAIIVLVPLFPEL